ncbi:hypothetical protein [Chryseobacterium potabilaquae]|uniref:Uncharacterized protein n=1 Tax=Chryseobacterium potabilaquae TaxID=2675057 RepID=A0A6N4X9N5_9FLAO|nr:hypothetical protein [Chryseobacterium potabilaquae]CAA7197004.1 hypothetical protein CHRY9293_03062 [Chryseobacterium potabilaquae]
MAKFTIIVIGLYIVYYIGNIVYDLFLKKENVSSIEESQVFSISDIAKESQEDIQNIEIEDVENLNTPHSFNYQELEYSSQDPTILEERPDIDVWRKKFEAEESIDSFEIEKNVLSKERAESSEIEKNNFEGKWKKMLNLAETNVQVITNIDGYKVYQSIM